MGSITWHRIDYNGLGVLRSQRDIPGKFLSFLALSQILNIDFFSPQAIYTYVGQFCFKGYNLFSTFLHLFITSEEFSNSGNKLLVRFYDLEINFINKLRFALYCGSALYSFPISLQALHSSRNRKFRWNTTGVKIQSVRMQPVSYLFTCIA